MRNMALAQRTLSFIDDMLIVVLAHWAVREIRGVVKDSDPRYRTTRYERFRMALGNWWRFSVWHCYGRLALLFLAHIITKACLRLIIAVNRSRDERLAFGLIYIAKRYARRPDRLACYLEPGDVESYLKTITG